MKRLLYALGVVVMIAAIVLVGYLVRPKLTSTTREGNTQTTTTGSFPENTPSQTPTTGATSQDGEDNTAQSVSLNTLGDSEKKFGLLYSGEVLAFRATTSTDILIIKPTGEILEITPAGEAALSSAPVKNLISAAFSFDGSFLLATIGTESGEQMSLFNIKEKTWSLLPETARGGVWAPNANTLAFTEDTGKATRIVSWNTKLPANKSTLLATMNSFDLLLSWPAPSTIIVSEKPSNKIKNNVFLLDTTKKTLSLFSDSEYGLLTAWGPSAKQAITLSVAPRVTGGLLTLRNQTGETLKTLSFLTIPSKCTFSTPAPSSTAEGLYCAIPRNASILAKTTLPDGYLMRETFTADDIYEVDLASGAFRFLPVPSDITVDVSEMQKSGQFIFFINRLDNKLYFVSES